MVRKGGEEGWRAKGAKRKEGRVKTGQNMAQAKTEVALLFSECCAAEVALQHSLFCSANVILIKSCVAANEKLHCSIEKAALQESGAFLPLSCGFQAPTFGHPRLGPADTIAANRDRNFKSAREVAAISGLRAKLTIVKIARPRRTQFSNKPHGPGEEGAAGNCPKILLPKRARMVLCTQNQPLSETKFLDGFWGPLPLPAPLFYC